MRTGESAYSSDTESQKQTNRDDKNEPHVWMTSSRSEASCAAELSYFSDLSNARDIRDLRQCILTAVNQMGFSDFSFVRMDSSGDVDSLVLATIPKSISQSYFDQGLYEHDVIIPYGRSKNRPIFRSQLENYLNQAPFENEMTETTREIYKLNKSHGYYDYFNMPKEANNGDGKVMFTVTQRGGNPFEFQQKVKQCIRPLELLSEATDIIAARNFPDVIGVKKTADNHKYKINRAPLRVLQTMANNDFNIQLLADNLSISLVTANKHLNTVRNILGVRTTHAAIKKAILHGLITYEN